MPVIGKILGYPSSSRVENMKVGEMGFLYLSDLFVTRKNIFLDIFSEINFLEKNESIEEYLDDFPESILVKRIGEGLTDSDFELDFSHLDNYYNHFTLDPSPSFFNLENSEKENYIVFSEFDLEIVTERVISEEETDEWEKLEDLDAALKKAIEKEDCTKAVKLRDQIHKFKKESGNS